MASEECNSEKEISPEAPSREQLIEELRWKKFPVLDDGFVCLVDVMGDDRSVVEAARVSYGQGTRHVSDDRTLLRYLMRHWHTTPFEMAEVKMLVRVPMDCWRQWVRHRTASINEYSTRYSVAIDSAQTTLPDQWRLQAQSNRQGSEGCLPGSAGERLSEAERKLQEEMRRVYQERLEAGVAREQARKDLPLSTYTEAYWKMNLHNLLHFLMLRLEENAQQEIRDYAAVIGNEIVRPLFPMTWDAFEDYRLGGVYLTRLDERLIARLMERAATSGSAPPYSVDDFQAVQDESWRPLARCRERDECLAKLQTLGIVAPSSDATDHAVG